MIQVKHFTNGADVLAHARAVARSRYAPRRIVPTQAAPTAEHAVSNAVVAPITVESAACSEIVGERDIIDLYTWEPLAERLQSPSSTTIARRIIYAAALKHGVSFDDIIGPYRTKIIKEARFEAVAGVYTELPHWSLCRIGKFFGDRDHTTILHAVRKMGVWRGATA